MTSKDIKPVIEQPDTEIPLMLSQAIIVGESVLTNGQIGAIALNGAALGFVAFLFAKLLDVKLGNRKTTAIIMLVVEVAAAIIGLIIMILMFRALYAA